jgi:hypothetical protein
MVIVEVVSKDMGVREISVKMQVAEKYSLACPKNKLWKKMFMN